MNTESSLLSKCVMVLEILSARSKPLRLRELVLLSGLAKSTVHRILSLLETERMVRHDRISKGYSVGMRIVEWSVSALDAIEVCDAARAEMEMLAAKTGEHVSLKILDLMNLVSIRDVEGNRADPYMTRSGTRWPYYSFASGKAIVAYLPKMKRDFLVENTQFRPLTANTVIDPEAFVRELDAVRQNGFAIGNRENSVETHGIAAPIFNQHKEPVAAISVWSPSHRTSIETIITHIKPLMAAANRISKRLQLGTAVQRAVRSR